MRFILICLLGLLYTHGWASEIRESDTIIGRANGYIIAVNLNDIINENNIEFGDKSAQIKRVWLTLYKDYQSVNTDDLGENNAIAMGYFSSWQMMDCTHKQYLTIVAAEDRPNIVMPSDVQVAYRIDGLSLAYEAPDSEYDEVSKVLFDKVCEQPLNT